VLGGYNGDAEFGSFSMNIKEGIGGRALRAGDFLPYTCKNLSENRRLPVFLRPDYDAPLSLRVIAGYQWNMFGEDERQKFFASTYRVTAQNDRMGYRLCGTKIKATCNGIISEPIAFGSIQIPSHGEPIVLLKERQTIGGYPKIGSVIPIDCFKLGQMKQDSVVTFTLIEKEEAREISKTFYGFFK
jgi:allophanate hydrolase subunit 2